jgi:hypothetical protein
MPLYRVTLITAAACTLMSAVPAAAQDAGADVRCFMASNMFAKAAKEEEARKVANLAGFFYLGRVTARLPKDGIKSAIAAQAKVLTPANAGETMTACAQRMNKEGEDIRSIGQQLDAEKPKK